MDEPNTDLIQGTLETLILKPLVLEPMHVSALLDDLRIAQRARKILGSETVWNPADNRECPPNRKTLSLYCALEKATLEVTGGFEHRGTRDGGGKNGH
ncbi:MAG TPA: hypothetical protein VHZ07_09935 [Bryobacteraceae bacterium]|jgi:hypothetical protein|nr:hypothetical protein [Bryobacteraceae bacterium]